MGNDRFSDIMLPVDPERANFAHFWFLRSVARDIAGGRQKIGFQMRFQDP
jgi:hypothetical protein